MSSREILDLMFINGLEVQPRQGTSQPPPFGVAEIPPGEKCLFSTMKGTML